MHRFTLILLLIWSSIADAQLQQYVGVRAGGVFVVQDNYPAFTTEHNGNWGWMLAVNRGMTLPWSPSTRLALEVSFRRSAWDRKYFGSQAAQYIDPRMETQEVTFSSLFLQYAGTDKAQLFLQAGPDISWVSFVHSPYAYDETHWQDIVLGFTVGGGVLIPAGDKEIILDIRYNTDVTESVDDSERDAPIGSRFDELHLLLGVNLPVEFFK